MASSTILAGFNIGLTLGVIPGAAAASLSKGEFHWQSFDTPNQTGHYLLGAVLIGVGGVVAGGCIVGAGLAGIASLSIAAILALAPIALGGLATRALLSEKIVRLLGRNKRFSTQGRMIQPLSLFSLQRLQAFEQRRRVPATTAHLLHIFIKLIDQSRNWQASAILIGRC